MISLSIGAIEIGGAVLALLAGAGAVLGWLHGRAQKPPRAAVSNPVRAAAETVQADAAKAHAERAPAIAAAHAEAKAEHETEMRIEEPTVDDLERSIARAEKLHREGS